VYLENFLSFPAGTKIPAAFYDRSKQRWVATSNGRVIRIVSINNGLASIDANGDGGADTDSALAVLGIDEGERRTLASLYTTGQSLWRVRTNHFSSLDCNFEIVGPTNAKKPKIKNPKRRIGKTATQCTARGWSIVDCANQSLRESIPIQGTPYAIEYDSSRAAHNQYSTTIELSDSDIPSSLRRIDLRVRIAGQDHLYHFTPQTNLKYTFTWDGHDGFGRPVQGAQDAAIDITYAYPVRYAYPEGDPAWNMPAEIIDIIERERVEFTLTESSEVLLGHFGSSDTGFGGWTFSPQRFYDGVGRTIYEAEGRERSTDPQQTRNTAIATLPVGDPDSLDLFTMAPAPDGSLYFSDGYQIRKLAADATISDIAGRTTAGFTPDGQPALGNPVDLWQFAAGPDGTLYVIDATRVRAIVNGRWVTVAGNSSYEQGVQPEGVPATSRSITAWSLTVAADGTVYVGGVGNIYKIDPDGILHTIAGTPQSSSFAEFTDGASATAVRLGRSNGVAVGPDGTIYFTNGTILGRVTTDGRVFHVMTASRGFFPEGVSVTGDGTVLVGDVNGKKVWAVAPDGSTSTFAGTGQFDKDAPPQIAGMSRSFPLLSPIETKVAADGSVLILDWDTESIRRAASAFPPARSGVPALIPSEGGSFAYVFEGGRHTRTVNTITGVALESFGYDGSGHLITVTDVDGLVTRIERDSAGQPTVIAAPNGQRTALSLSAGQLHSISAPSGVSQTFGYGAGGLLSQLTDRRGGQHKFTYDNDGLLLRDDDPVGGFIGLARNGDGSTFGVTRTSAEGRTQSFATAVDSTGKELQSSVGTTGLAAASATFGATATTSSPALSISVDMFADQRFGMLSPVPSSATLTTGTKTLHLTHSRAATTSGTNILVPTSVSGATTVNSRTWISSYNAMSRVLTSTNPSGRQATATLDARGRPILMHVPLIMDITNGYDQRGRMTTVSSGSRTTTVTYDDLDRVQSITDPLQHTVRFDYDAANRVTAKTLNDGRIVRYTYDDAGNLTSVTPPSRPAHLFTFTGIDFLDTYTPPPVVNSGSTRYRYNRDRQIVSLLRPDGTEITKSYDSAGRLASVSTPLGGFGMSYSAATGLIESITVPGGVSTSYAYDGAIPTTITSSGLVNASIAIAYDNELNVTSKKIGTAPPIVYGYDSDGLLTSIGVETIFRAPENGRVTTTNAGLINDTRSYDGFGQIGDYTALLNSSPLFEQHYTRDAAGRITAIAETIGSTTSTRAFTYDASGRLAGVVENGATVAAYTYDGNSNRLTRVRSSGTESGTYDDQDRVTSYGGYEFAYTANGEIASKTSAFGTTSYRYDSFGNLVRVALPGGHVVEYVLDGRSRRVAKKVDGTVTQKFVYSDGLRPIAQLAPDDAVVFQFLYGERAHVPSLIVGTSATYRVIADHSGSPRGIVDVATGASVQYLAYDEFGNVTTDTNSGFQPYGFAGGLYDPDTHLVHFGAREYDPSLGRFLSRDPLGFGGGQLNVYDYAANDPVNFIDPSGLLFHNEFHVDAGEETGAEALELSADVLTNPKASLAAKTEALISAVAGALWSPCTSDATLQAVAMGLFSLATAPAPAAELAASQGGLNLYKWGDATAIAENGWKEGDRYLYLPDQGSAQANWLQNASRLRAEMGEGKPIFDSYRDALTGEQIPTRGFLNAERNLLENHGWTYNPQAGAYFPPGE
jgi:RHS repeat-associated protein